MTPLEVEYRIPLIPEQLAGTNGLFIKEKAFAFWGHFKIEPFVYNTENNSSDTEKINQNVNKFQDDYSDGFRKNNQRHKKFIPKKKFKKHK